MAQAKKRKKFFDVSMPLINKKTQLYSYNIEDLNGRIIFYDSTRLFRGKSVLLKLKVDVKDDHATAKPHELKIMPCSLRRMIRKGTNYVEDSFSAECKNAVLRIKTFLITRKKVSRVIRKALRDKAKEELTNYVKGKNTEILFDDVMKNKIQRSLSQILKKIYPLSLCEIRTLKIERFKEKGKKADKE